MRLSVRNQLDGKVLSIVPGSVMTIVKVALKGGQTVTSSVTTEAVEDLDLDIGDRVVVLVKSTEVMLGVDDDKAAGKSKKKSRKKNSKKRYSRRFRASLTERTFRRVAFAAEFVIGEMRILAQCFHDQAASPATPIAVRIDERSRLGMADRDDANAKIERNGIHRSSNRVGRAERSQRFGGRRNFEISGHE